MAGDWFDSNAPTAGAGGTIDLTRGADGVYSDFGMPGATVNQPQPGAPAASGGGFGSLILNSPSYQFQRDEGTRGIQNSAAAQGTLLTGGTLKALSRFNQGLASSFDDKYWNRNFSLASLGQNAAAGVGNLGSAYAQNAGDTYLQQGNAQAAGTIGGVNAINNGLNQYLTYRQGGYGPPSSYPSGGYYPPMMSNF